MSQPQASPSQTVAASATAAGHTANEFLTFKLGSEEYGLEILKVQEIRGYDAITHIANAPEFIKGVVNLRGIIVPIIDMRIKFNLPLSHLILLFALRYQIQNDLCKLYETLMLLSAFCNASRNPHWVIL